MAFDPRLLGALAACALGCGAPGATVEADASLPPDAPTGDTGGCGLASPTGVHAGTITVAGVERSYIRVVPADYESSRRYPLVFAWHGRTGTATLARQYFGIEAAAGGDAIIIYPQGLDVSATPGDTGWELTAGGRDVALFDALLAETQASYCILGAFSIGHSFGGYFSNTLACHRGGTVRAIASIAGGGPFGACGASPVSAVIIHGTQDQVVPYTQGEASRDHWRAAAGCAGTTTATEPAPCVAYDACQAPLSVRFCSHDDPAGAGHGWPAFAAGAAWRLFADDVSRS